MRIRVTIGVSRKSGLGLGWIASLFLACAVGWGIGRLGSDSAQIPASTETHIAAHPAPVIRDVSTPPSRPSADLATAPVEDLPDLPVVERESVAPPAVKPKAAPKKPVTPPADPPVAEPPPTAIAELLDPVPPPPPAVRERARQADRLAESGESDGARATAEALFAEFPSTTALAAALVEAGAIEVEAKLETVRLLQLAGRDGISRSLARELKRSYAGTASVLESIDRWGLLTPRIVAVESSVENGRELVVSGTLENPDIGDVRQVRILVEALDGAGSVLATAEARIRPKVLPPGSKGDFSARFKKLDPTTVLRTRTVLVGWESEVLNAG